MWSLLLATVAWAAPVTFQVNDALVKDRPLEAVVVRAAVADEEPVRLGATDAAGRLVADLAPGTWRVSYGKEGYVPIPASPTPVPAEGATITATLTPLLESTGDAGHRRVQIVLNWGSGWQAVPDADAHLVCVDGVEVYFGATDHVASGHEVRLDVDDVDWGGPETITLLDPAPGSYEYYVRDFTGRRGLGQSDVVVRVVLDDTPAGEFRIPGDVRTQDWLPFRALVVEEDGRPRIEPFTPEDLAAGRDRRTTFAYDLGCAGTSLCMWLVGIPLLLGVAMAVRRLVSRGFRRR